MLRPVLELAFEGLGQRVVDRRREVAEHSEERVHAALRGRHDPLGCEVLPGAGGAFEDEPVAVGLGQGPVSVGAATSVTLVGFQKSAYYCDLGRRVRNQPWGSSPAPSTRPGQHRHPGREAPAPKSPGECLCGRFVLTARTELTDRMLIFSERHLRSVLAEYEANCNGRRHHRSRQLRPPRPDHPAVELSRSGSSASRCSAVSSMNTSEPHKRPLQHQ